MLWLDGTRLVTEVVVVVVVVAVVEEPRPAACSTRQSRGRHHP